MKVLGLDLSLCSSGCVVIDGSTIVNERLIKSKPSGPSPVDELKRLIKIKDEIAKIVAGNKIDLAVIEGLAFCARNTVALVQLAGLNYMVREMLYELQIPFILVAPSSLKKFITLRGNAQKDEMLLETYKRYGVSFTDNNLCDGYGLSMCGLALLGNYSQKLTSQQVEVIGLLKKQEVIINVRTKLYEVDKIGDVK